MVLCSYFNFDHVLYFMKYSALSASASNLFGTGLKSMNQIILPSSQKNLDMSEKVSFVSLFTVYNNSRRPKLGSTDDNLDKKVIVGSVSYTKTERSIAILNTFINFIHVCMASLS